MFELVPDNEEAIFNPWCSTHTLLEWIRRKCKCDDSSKSCHDILSFRQFSSFSFFFLRFFLYLLLDCFCLSCYCCFTSLFTSCSASFSFSSLLNFSSSFHSFYHYTTLVTLNKMTTLLSSVVLDLVDLEGQIKNLSTGADDYACDYVTPRETYILIRVDSECLLRWTVRSVYYECLL